MSEQLIVVPLDGSELSERAVPLAVGLAKATSADIAFLMVREHEDSAPSGRRAELAQESERYHSDYMDRIARQAESVSVETVVRTGDPADEILQFTEERSAHFVVMASHGRSGLSRWRYGSVADKIVHSSTVPILLIGPRVLEENRVTAINHILVPLDGSEQAQQALALATDLARSLKAKLSLARVVKWAAQMYPYAMPETYTPALTDIDTELEAEAKDSLAKLARGLTGLGEVDAVVLRGTIADSLIDYVEQSGVDLVIMTTHARSGLARAALGSVADRMLHGPSPVLLVRPVE